MGVNRVKLFDVGSGAELDIGPPGTGKTALSRTDCLLALWMRGSR